MIKGYDNIGDVLKDMAILGVAIGVLCIGSFLIVRFQKARSAARMVAENQLMDTKLRRVNLPLKYDWALWSLDEKQTNLSQFKGKVLFINIWASWCPACQHEMPSIERLYARFKGRDDIAFLIISTENVLTVSKFIRKHSYTFPVYVADKNYPETLTPSVLPETFIVSKEGRLVARAQWPLRWDAEKPIKLLDSLSTKNP